jgi:hypothetical protein
LGVLPNDFKYNDEIAHPNDDISSFPFALWIVSNLGAMKNKPLIRFWAHSSAKKRSETSARLSLLRFMNVNKNRRETSRRPSWLEGLGLAEVWKTELVNGIAR